MESPLSCFLFWGNPLQMLLDDWFPGFVVVGMMDETEKIPLSDFASLEWSRAWGKRELFLEVNVSW